MATANPFDLLGDDDTDDPSQLIAAHQLKILPKKPPPQTQQAQHSKTPKLPTKPIPPAQAVKEAKSEGARGGGRGYGRGRGGGGGGFNRELANNENSFLSGGFSGGQRSIEESDSGRPYERRGGYGGSRGSFRGGRRNDDVEDNERNTRVLERRSGTGRGNEYKREGAGRGNWGSQTEQLSSVAEEVGNEGEKSLGTEKSFGEEGATDDKENPANKSEEKEPEDKEMTLEEYEKVLEEKRKALEALKTEERKVAIDKELASMQQLSNKKSSDDIFIKLGLEKDKRKEIAEKEEKAKKSLSINEFLKPAEGEKYYNPDSRGRGRGRGRGSRGGGAFSTVGSVNTVEAPAIEDTSEFPTLGGTK